MLPWQLQRFTQMRRILVTGKARLVGCDFEQHAARRPEIDREEIVAIDHRRQLVARIHQSLADDQLVRLGRYRKGDMVHRSGAVAGGSHQPLDARMRIGNLIVHELEELFGGPLISQPQRRRMEAADRLVAGNSAMRPWQANILLVLDQCESVSVRSAETQPFLPEACFAREAADAARPEPLFPPAERILWNAEYRGSHLAGPRPAPHDVWEREVGHHRAGCADFITV